MEGKKMTFRRRPWRIIRTARARRFAVMSCPSGTASQKWTMNIPASASFTRALTHRNYRLYLLGQGVSLIGTWMQQVAMAWLVYRQTGSPLLLGVIGFSTQIPSLLISPLAGVVADRWNRHRALVITQSLAMVQA